MTENEKLQQLRTEAEPLLGTEAHVLRSCWNCNGAHEYMRHWDDVIIQCFDCGHIYYKGTCLTTDIVDVTESIDDNNFTGD